MRLERLELSGFKSFAKKTELLFTAPVVAIVGPNGSGKSNIAEACRWVLGEQSLKSLRGRRGEDFIWHGSEATPRANRASVAMIFDNADHRFPLDASEVAVTREVLRDGTSDYSINQSSVRLRDLNELLHHVSIGASGYHIIRQGEADRILTSSVAERREIVETALGLRLYEWQLSETEKKLAKTGENLKQVELLRKEIAPHLRFLKKEMEKVEKSRTLRQELKALALNYFSQEARHLELETARLDRVEGELEKKVKELNATASALERELGGESAVAKALRQELSTAEAALRRATSERELLARELGRIEGRIEADKAVPLVTSEAVAGERVRSWVENLETWLEQSRGLTDLNLLRAAWDKLKEVVSEMKQAVTHGRSNQAEVTDWSVEQARVSERLVAVGREIRHEEAVVERVRAALTSESAARGAAAGQLLEAKLKASAEEGKLASLRLERDRLKHLRADFERELAEAVALTDRELLDYKHTPATGERVPEAVEATRRRLERLKLQLEEHGVGSGELTREYEEAAAREAHLAREVADLEGSVASLNQVAADLKAKIDDEFATGLKRINQEFQNFFHLLFGGGKAELRTVKLRVRRGDDEGEFGEGEAEAEVAETGGLEIEVSLPRKRISGLEMLSGGERSLTSIALLFALSRVHPPPFMILDETDAALDEANSKKYGDMVEALAKETQLILITHNRETMSRADLIYGVTMGSDGVSRLLSIKLDAAIGYAK